MARDKRRRDLPAWQIWDRFWRETTIAGVQHAGRSKRSWLRRSVWLVTFAIGLGLTFQAVFSVVTDFLSYPVVTSVTVAHSSQMMFPAVTVCNLNRVNCNNLRETMNRCAVDLSFCNGKAINLSRLRGLNQTTQCDKVLALPGSPGKSPAPQVPATPTVPVQPNGQNLQPKVPLSNLGDQSQDAKDEASFLALYMGLDESVRLMIGHRYADMIKSCTFGGRDCFMEKNFKPVSNPSYGSCLTFNTKLNPNDTLAGARFSSQTGPNFGLSLVLNLDQDAYMKGGQTRQAGARFSVHPPDSEPILEDSGMDVEPQTLTRAALKEVNMARLPAPYPTGCYSSWSYTNYTDYFPASWPYDLAACHRTCLFSSILQDCACFHPLFLRNDVHKKGLLPCNLIDTAPVATCVNRTMAQFEDGTRKCRCSVACQSLTYEVSLSTSIWPCKEYMGTAAKLYGFENVDPLSSGLKDNLLQLNVFFKTLDSMHVDDSPKYQSDTYVGALGGALSIYMGFSLFMLLEVLEYLVDMMACGASWMRSSWHRGSSDDRSLDQKKASQFQAEDKLHF